MLFFANMLSHNIYGKKPVIFLLTEVPAGVLQVVSILESRARAIDLTQHSYYHLLYAFHVFRSNYRKGELSPK